MTRRPGRPDEAVHVEAQPQRARRRSGHPQQNRVDDQGEQPEGEEGDRERQQPEHGSEHRVDDPEDERDPEEAPARLPA
jgi:hypothetical protein